MADVSTFSQTTAFDAVVAGGGSAGITVARTLGENGKRVAVIESGPLALLTHIQSTDLRFDSKLVSSVQSALQYSPSTADGAPFGSLIGCVGGRGLFWNGAAPRFPPEAFDGWPVRYKALEEHYAWAESQFRVSRTYGDTPLGQTVCRLLRRAGLPAEPGPFAVDDLPTADGHLAGTVGNSLAPLLESGLLTKGDRYVTLASDAFTRKVLVEKGVARGVEVVDRGTGTVYPVFGRTIVLAAGAFESVRLALASNLPDPNRLLGRYISDHIFCRAYYPLPPELYNPSRPEVAILWIPARGQRDFQVEIHLPADNLFALRRTDWKPDDSATYAAMVRSFGPVAPRHENFIELLAGDNPGRFRVHLSLDADDLARRAAMVDMLDLVRVALGASKADVQLMPQGSSHHEAGGLCMGEDDKASVTDPYGRFRGVNRLFVTDASTWPDVSPANPHLTIVALARRAARQLLTEL